MSANKELVQAYMARKTNAELEELIADDVEWIEWGNGVPSNGVRTKGKAAYLENFGSDELTTEVLRMTEEGSVVVVEGLTRVQKQDGRVLSVRFCDIFEIESGKVKRLNSFGALLKDAP